MRLEIYRWFHRLLQPGAPPVAKEPPVRVETDETLWVTKTGNVVTELHGITPHRMAAQRAAAIATPAQAPNLPALLRLQPASKASIIQLGKVESRHAVAESIEVTSAPGVWVPAWLFLPAAPKQAEDPLIVALEPAGRNARWNEDSVYQQIAAGGRPVCAPDLRGIGDLNPEFPRHAARHAQPHQQEEHYAWASMMLGVPLLGQRVDDILALVRGLAAYPSTRGRRIALAASGKMTVAALFAAAIEPSISAVYLAGGLVSFRNLVEHPHPTHPFANYLFDVLRHTDLPQLAASIAPRTVMIGGCVDAANRRLPADEVRSAYASANVTVLPDSAWNSETLSRL
jgi:hypothetical protein